MRTHSKTVVAVLILLLLLQKCVRAFSPVTPPSRSSTTSFHRVEQNMKDDPHFTEITLDDAGMDLPTKFAYPHNYKPHPIAMWAANELKEQLKQAQQSSHSLFGKHLTRMVTGYGTDAVVGKMFGVLVVQIPNNQSKFGYLKAYSGTLPEEVITPQHSCQRELEYESFHFAPMLFDRFDTQGFYKQGEAQLNAINEQVETLEQNPELITRRTNLERMELHAKQALAEARKEQKAQKEERRQKRLECQTTFGKDSEEYRALDAQLIQDGAAVQRQVKALKVQLDNEFLEAKNSLMELQDPLDNLKELRKTKSANLQNLLFDQYQLLNMRGETISLLPLFEKTPLKRPPTGAGDCAAPKLLQYAFSQNYKPIAMAEFWWGRSPSSEIRKHNFYYPACRGKCGPILQHMLQGLGVEKDPAEQLQMSSREHELEIIYEDDYMLVVNKPHDVLSVPGRQVQQSVYTEIKKRYPNATGPLLVHRLDMSTSGLLVVAKEKDIHEKIQAQFIDRSIRKRYTALLDGEFFVEKNANRKGKVDLPLSGDYLNRPMQKVDFEQGKPAVTYYEILEDDSSPPKSSNTTRVYFYPVTGRTHQLRVHAAHEQGLNIPILGDDIYGQTGERLFLHASYLEMTHPVSEKRMTFTSDAPF